MKIGLFYGTTSAATQEVADLINDNQIKKANFILSNINEYNSVFKQRN